MEEILPYVILIVIPVLFCIYIGYMIKNDSPTKKSPKQESKDEKKVEAARKEGYSDFKQQLDQLVLSKEEKTKKEETVSSSAFQKELKNALVTKEEARKQKEEEERLAKEQSRKQAAIEVEKYMKDIHRRILEKARLGEYTVKDSKKVIAFDVESPYFIYPSIRIKSYSYCLDTNSSSYDKAVAFLEILSEEGRKDNISFSLIAKKVNRHTGTVYTFDVPGPVGPLNLTFQDFFSNVSARLKMGNRFRMQNAEL